MASKAIKGITIEIGGDVAPLNKALADVDRSSSKLKSELREVEKLLKLDPTNTELLSQKQKLLSDAVSTARDKLDMLKKAQIQAEEQFKNGDIGEAEYRAFQREVVKAEQSLNAAEKASKDFGDEMQDTGKEVNKAGNETEEAGKQAKQSGEDAKTGGSGWQKLGSLASGAAKITVGAVAAVGTAAVTAAAGIVKMGTDAGKAADDLITLSNKTGVSVETLQKWEYAARFVDVEVETMTKSMAKLTKSMDAARDGSKTQSAAFATLGVSVTDTNGQLRNNEDVMFDVIDALGAVKNETEADALAMELFGKSAQELNPLIRAGGDELRRLGEEAAAAGLVLDEHMVAKLGEFDDTMQRTEAQMQGIGKQIAVNFLPALQAAGSAVSSLMTDINKSLSDGFQPEDIKEIGKSISKMLINGMKKITEYIPEFVNTVSTVLTEVVNLLVTMIPVILPPLVDAALQLISGILNAITNNVDMIVNAITQIISMMITFIISNLPQFLEAGIQILTSLINGIAQALPDIIQAIVDMIPQLVQAITDNLPALIDAGITLLLSLVDGLIEAIPQLLEALPTIIDELLNGLLGAIPQLIDAGIQLLTSLVDALPEIIDTIVKVLPEIIRNVIDALLDHLPDIIEAGIDLLIALVTDLPKIIIEIVKAIPQIISGIVTAIGDKFPDIINKGKDLFVSLVKKLPEAINDIVSKIPGLINSIVDGIGDGFGQLKDAGMNLIEGLWEGISSAKDWILDKIGGFMDSIVGGIKSFFGINSPSTLFRDLIGANLVKGIGVGVEVEAPNLQKDITDNLEAVTAGVQSTLNMESAKIAVNGTAADSQTASLGGLHFHIDKVENASNRDIQDFMNEAMEYADEYIRRRGRVFA